MKKAIVFTGPNWQWCDRVKDLLSGYFDVKAVDIVENITELRAATKVQIRTVPQVVIDGVYVGGYAECEEYIKNEENLV